MQSDAKLLTIYRLSWVASLTIVLIGVAVVIAVRADDISGMVAKVEPPSKPDGTLAHPQCGREPVPTQYRHSYLAGRVAFDPEHP
jgi:hypothetical protein